jgi:hypothetical protein
MKLAVVPPNRSNATPISLGGLDDHETISSTELMENLNVGEFRSSSAMLKPASFRQVHSAAGSGIGS